MDEFFIYAKLGFQHITDLNGYDHILFITALCAVYFIKDLKALLILVTAFTIGHSLTLALAVLDIVQVNADLIEILIPVTIIITALFNFFQLSKGNLTYSSKQGAISRYFLAMTFGLIHGLGFSNYLKSLLLNAKQLFVPLLSFNIGLEIGQIIVVILLMLLCYLVVNILRIKPKYWTIGLTSIVLILSTMILFDRLSLSI